MRGKIVFVGATHVGKTSIINRFMTGGFAAHTSPTAQGAFYEKAHYYRGEKFVLEIWDTAGQEQYHALSPMYYRNAQVGIVVFDLTDKETFRQCQQWVSELRQALGDVSIIIAANKCDLASQRSIWTATFEEFADSVRAEAFETSAKTGANIEALFETAVRCIAARGPTSMERTLGKGKRSTSSVRFDTSFSERDEGCC
jgi:small GTP-binding protein